MKVSGLLLACVALLPLHALGKDSEEEHGVLRGTQAATGPTESLSLESRNVSESLSLMAQDEDAADRDLQAVVKPCRRPRYCRDVRPNLPTPVYACPPWESCPESCWISYAEIVIPIDFYTKIDDNASVRVVGSAMQTCKTIARENLSIVLCPNICSRGWIPPENGWEVEGTHISLPGPCRME